MCRVGISQPLGHGFIGCISRWVGLCVQILSNGTPHMLDAVVSNAGLAGLFDDVISVQSSNAGDVYAASAFGMHVVWCNRYGQRPERVPGKPDREVGSLVVHVDVPR